MTDYQKLEAIYNEIDTLIANNVMANLLNLNRGIQGLNDFW